jgi:hypothetical protein
MISGLIATVSELCLKINGTTNQIMETKSEHLAACLPFYQRLFTPVTAKYQARTAESRLIATKSELLEPAGSPVWEIYYPDCNKIRTYNAA